MSTGSLEIAREAKYWERWNGEDSKRAKISTAEGVEKYSVISENLFSAGEHWEARLGGRINIET